MSVNASRELCFAAMAAAAAASAAAASVRIVWLSPGGASDGEEVAAALALASASQACGPASRERPQVRARLAKKSQSAVSALRPTTKTAADARLPRRRREIRERADRLDGVPAQPLVRPRVLGDKEVVKEGAWRAKEKDP